MTMDRRKFLESSSVLLSAAALSATGAALGSTAAAAADTPEAPKRKLRLVPTEEAFATSDQIESFRKARDTHWHDPDLDQWRMFLNASIVPRLLDIENERLNIMDKAGVDMHLLSLTSPGVQLLDADAGTGLATSANDQLAEVIKRHPARFAGLASFAPQDPQRAAKEIDRAINKLKLNGLIVNSHTNGEYLDQTKFWPIFEAISANNVPLYIHPRNPPDPAFQLLRGDVTLWSAIWGYQWETSLHAMRLIINGVFDQFPNLKIVLGHMGEGLPYWLYRIDYMYAHAGFLYASASGRPRLKKKPSDYIKDNFLITTSGMNDHAVLKYCLEVLGPDNVMFAIDYPYQETFEAVKFMNTAPLPQAHLEKVAYGNAEKLFRIQTA